MKKITLIFSVAVAALLLQAHSCHKNGHSHGCGPDIICTEIFAAVMVQVKDAAGDPVKLDDYYTIRLKNDERISGPAHNPENGSYVVVDDNFISTLKDKTEGFKFVGIKNGVEVVNETYQVSGDCCHVNKDSGKDVIIVP